MDSLLIDWLTSALLLDDPLSGVPFPDSPGGETRRLAQRLAALSDLGATLAEFALRCLLPLQAGPPSLCPPPPPPLPASLYHYPAHSFLLSISHTVICKHRVFLLPVQHKLGTCLDLMLLFRKLGRENVFFCQFYLIS